MAWVHVRLAADLAVAGLDGLLGCPRASHSVEKGTTHTYIHTDVVDGDVTVGEAPRVVVSVKLKAVQLAVGAGLSRCQVKKSGCSWLKSIEEIISQTLNS
uniref:Uncharacterized protein n=1 Tax=Oryza nivara TaxID=4536 RepID=A0A0E0G518_ORYNI